MSNEQCEDFKRFLRSKSMHIMEKEDVDYFGTIAGNAYPIEYPIFEYYFGEKNDRERVVLTFLVNYRAVFRQGVGFSPEDTSLGSALVVPPKHKRFTMMDFMLVGGIKMFLKAGKKACDRMTMYEDYCASLLNKYSDKDTWYFQNLSVAREHQGEGVGSKLMTVLFEYMDSIDAPCYLETHSKPNEHLYEHFGFEIMEVGHLPGTDIEHYALLRKRKSERCRN